MYMYDQGSLQSVAEATIPALKALLFPTLRSWPFDTRHLIVAENEKLLMEEEADEMHMSAGATIQAEAAKLFKTCSSEGQPWQNTLGRSAMQTNRQLLEGDRWDFQPKKKQAQAVVLLN